MEERQPGDRGNYIGFIFISFLSSVSANTMISISDQLKRARAIADIEGESFSQKVCLIDKVGTKAPTSTERYITL